MDTWLEDLAYRVEIHELSQPVAISAEGQLQSLGDFIASRPTIAESLGVTPKPEITVKKVTNLTEEELQKVTVAQLEWHIHHDDEITRDLQRRVYRGNKMSYRPYEEILEEVKAQTSYGQAYMQGMKNMLRKWEEDVESGKLAAVGPEPESERHKEYKNPFRRTPREN